MFFRPHAKTVEDAFKTLPNQRTEDLLKFYQDNIKISNYNLSEGTITKYGTEINEF